MLGCSFSVGAGLVSLLTFSLTAMIMATALREPICIARNDVKGRETNRTIFIITATKATLTFTFTVTLAALAHKHGFLGFG